MAPTQEQLDRMERKIDEMRREQREDMNRFSDGFKQWQEKQDDKIDEHSKMHAEHSTMFARIIERLGAHSRLTAALSTGITGLITGLFVYIKMKG